MASAAKVTCICILLCICFICVYSGACPNTVSNGAVHHRPDGSTICYWAVQDYKTKDAGQTKCQYDGGHLALIPDQAASTDALAYINSNANAWSIWIGYYINTYEQVMTYNDDTVTWYNFGSHGIPSTSGVSKCLYMCHASTGKWCAASSCGDDRQSLCSYESPTVASTSQTTTDMQTTITTEKTTEETTTHTTRIETTTGQTEMTTQTTGTEETTTTTLAMEATTTDSEATTERVTSTETTVSGSTTTNGEECESTSSQTSSVSTFRLCACDCVVPSANISSDWVAELEKITAELTVNKSTLSSVRRSKTSASDPRPSATYVGSAGIVLLSVVFGMIITFDVTRCFSV